MTKAELIDRVSKDAGPTISKKMVGSLVESIFEHLHKAIKKDKRFTYPGFGTFAVKKRNARKGRNPKTGEVIMIAPTKTVAFKPAPNFKASLK
ncbi:MAG: integration host factor [Deltaproteobacteria bacterium RIFOXYA12_FULL_58_15]|nr:MAG: integration host factor [Deltaproteobacteria bacterium RIFOXYA12_FULL_58_15]OGR10200.1 MAG: integration host factor [Deltaproteobacteria bacterium RIFOXYB12_FULL_58_9]